MKHFTVRCYGGCKHGEAVTLSEDMSHLRAARPRLERRPLGYGPLDPRDQVYEPMHEIDTYRLDTYRERRGGGWREMKVAILEGRELYREEQWQLDKDIQDVRWRPIKEPNFLTEFDRWFAWCVYKHTGEFKYIREEMRLCEW
jgi:hypothetical protein